MMIDMFVGILMIIQVVTTPYVSQRGPGADMRQYDCGGAAAAMVIGGATGIEVSVDELMGDKGDVYTTYTGIQNMVAPYGVELDAQWFNTPDTLRHYVQGQGPVLMVVVYSHLNPYARAGAWHWVWVIDADNDGFHYHDPWLGPSVYASDSALFAGLDATDVGRVGIVIKE